MTVTINGSGSITEEITIDGVKVGQGGGNVSTNTAVGASALAANTTGASNTAVGYQALDATTTGGNNVAVGNNALGANTTAANNTAIGVGALASNTTGASNVAVGQGAMDASTTGSFNTALGRYALLSNTTGPQNTAVGYEALALCTTGDTNTALGQNALSSTTGNANLGIGQGAGANLTTGNGNVCIQDFADRGASARIFNVTTESDRVVMGHNFVTNAYVKVAWTVTSDARDKTSIQPVPHGLSFVQQLNPVSYQFRKSREDDTPKGNRRYGFLAQDILALEGGNPVIIDNEQPDHLKYQGEALVPVLVNAIKELSAQVTALQAEVNALKGQ